MTLEQQVVSLELAKQLKELGVKQDSLFYWWLSFKFEKEEVYSKVMNHKPEQWEKLGIDRIDVYSAFTVAELGEMLPQGFFTAKGKKFRGWFSDTDNPFEWHEGDEYDPIDNKNEANLRAKMLIWLIENKYLDPKDI